MSVPATVPAALPRPPELTGIAVHWGEPARVAELLAAWPPDERFELLVVDNTGRLAAGWPPAVRGRVLGPGRNLGFAGGVNAGAAAAAADRLLILNPDAVPEPGALERLLEGFDRWPGAAGLAPRLRDPEARGGQSQWRWQLRRLPGPAALLLHALFLPAGGALTAEPAAGAVVEQPAAAALALQRSALAAVGGLDEGFYPAWFEDVDLARRLRNAGLAIRYHPEAAFRHHLGSSVPALGYGPFLWIYHRNLVRYLGKHHGPGWSAAARVLTLLGAKLRLLLLPLRRPRRAATRREAAAGLAAAALGAASGWRLPRAWAERWRRPAGLAEDAP
jgi:GT2 family glycosyltransferase